MFTAAFGFGSQAAKFTGKAIAAGEHGSVLYTGDGGGIWGDLTVDTGFDGNLLKAAHNGGTTVVGGILGFVQVTTNGGTSWTAYPIDTTNEITAIHYDTSSSAWIVAARDTLYKTTDFSSWTNLGTIEDFNVVTDLTDDGTTLVAVGWNKLVYTSTDGGTSWTERSFTGITASDTIFYGVQFANSIFVAVGEDGNIQYSSDAITWTKATVGVSSHLKDVHYYNSSLWIAVGTGQRILTSSDATTWDVRFAGSGQNSTANYKSIESNGATVAILSENDNDYQTSTNGTTWTKRDITVTGYTPKNLAGETVWLQELVYDSTNSKWVACGYSNATATGFDLEFYKSWTVNSSDITGAFTQTTNDGRSYATYRSVVYDADNEDWYMVVDGTTRIVKSSDDGGTWTVIDVTALPSSPFTGQYPLGGLFYENSTYILTDANGKSLYSSSDFSTWTKKITIVTEFLTNKAGSFTNGRMFVLGKDGYFAYDDGADTWTQGYVSNAFFSYSDIYDVEFIGSVYVFVFQHGKIITTTNLGGYINRTNATSSTSSVVHLVSFNNKLYAYLANGEVHSSADGITWTLASSGHTGYFESGTDLSFKISSNNGKMCLIASENGLYRTGDNISFTQVDLTGSGYSGNILKSVRVVPS